MLQIPITRSSNSKTKGLSLGTLIQDNTVRFFSDTAWNSKFLYLYLLANENLALKNPDKFFCTLYGEYILRSFSVFLVIRVGQ